MNQHNCTYYHLIGIKQPVEQIWRLANIQFFVLACRKVPKVLFFYSRIRIIETRRTRFISQLTRDRSRIISCTISDFFCWQVLGNSNQYGTAIKPLGYRLLQISRDLGFVVTNSRMSEETNACPNTMKCKETWNVSFLRLTSHKMAQTKQCGN